MQRRLCAVLVTGAFISSCSGSSTPTSPSSETAFQGTVAGTGGQSGTLTVTVRTVVAASSAAFFRFPFIATLHAQTTGTVTATGSLRLIGGSTIPLTGTFDSSTKVLNLSGAGFTFAGTLSGGVLSGTYTGPNGVSGGFSSLSTTGATVTAYCGTFVRNDGVRGVFNVQVSTAGTVSGVAEGGIYIRGQVSGNTVTTTATSPSGTIVPGTSTIQNGTVTGRDDTGFTSWTGSTSACQ